jgi:hypothetical protein
MTTLYHCPECEWQGHDDATDPIEYIHERIMPGELMAAGCCPECGALISVDDADVPDYTLQACATIMRARGWQVIAPDEAADNEKRSPYQTPERAKF